MATNNQYDNEAEYDCKHWETSEPTTAIRTVPTSEKALHIRHTNAKNRGNLAYRKSQQFARCGNAELAKQYEARSTALIAREDELIAKHIDAMKANQRPSRPDEARLRAALASMAQGHK